MKISNSLVTGFLILLFSAEAYSKEVKSNCASGMLSVDHQCVAVGNRVSFNFQTVHSVKRSSVRLKTGSELTKIEISGRGNAGSFGGSLQNAIPMTVHFTLKESLPEKSDRAFSEIQACYQGALLSMSSKEKYIFSFDLESERAIAPGVIEGGDGVFEVQNDLKSVLGENLMIQCGSSLKAQ